MIQILTYSGKNSEFMGRGVEVNSIHNAKSLDDFVINIIDLNDKEIWKSKCATPKNIEYIYDIKSMEAMVTNSCKTQIVVLLPQNLRYQYFYDRYKNEYVKGIELKDIISDVVEDIIDQLSDKLYGTKLIYENTETQIGGMNIRAAFYFNSPNGVPLLYSTSGKKVACKNENVIATTLRLENYNQIIQFLKRIGLISEKQEIPKWMEEVQMFDDIQQLDLIRENREKIQMAEQEINRAKKVMDQNNRYKSILYTTGDELVEVTLDILGQILNYDFSQFEDKKNEDFLAEIGDDVFIGEIKGVNHNVKSENISQLDVHYQGYLDNNDKQSENVYALLIMNHQKNKPVADREPVHERQVNLAKRNGSLIIDTYMLLKMFEKLKQNEISREACIDILKSNTGILTSI